jgi:hypothetical protein
MCGTERSAMRSTGQCLVKAAEMDRASDTCPNAMIAASYEILAKHWRRIAEQAARQDRLSSDLYE